MITINGNQYRNLPEQVEKNKQDIANITKDKTVTIYTFNLTNDTDPNIQTKFSGTITSIGNVVIAVNGVLIVDTATYPVVEFNQPDTNKIIRISGYSNQLIDIDMNDFDSMDTYILY